MTDVNLEKGLAPEKGLGPEQIADRIERVLAGASLAEKVAMMSGAGFFAALKASGGHWGADPYRAGGGLERFGIDPLYFTDGPRGVVRGKSTCFPCTMARGASFDRDLEQRIGEVMGIEARAQGCTLSGAVCINLLRHPGWGRAQETYGEDPYHLGEMGAALATGIQSHNVVATVKHFAANSIENARFKVDVRIDPRTLREDYLTHIKRVHEAGCASVMSAYNKLNGEYCGQNRHLLTDILRGEWGFDGFVHSDWVLGVYEQYGAAAGLDVENPEPRVFGEKLVAAVEAGHVEPQVIDQACRRILTITYRFACAEDPLEAYTPDLVACAAHRALAREAAEKSAVLLHNDGLLPLNRGALRTVAVIGRLADLVNTGDNGSSRVAAPEVITPLAGLRDALGPDVRLITADEEDLEAVRRAAAQADAVIVVAGLTAAEEGEFIPGDGLTQAWESGGDRRSLRLPLTQETMIGAAAEANPKTAVVVIAGSAIVMEPWRGAVAAILQPFYCGMDGGRAIADILLGAVNPSGKLPFTVPADEADLPHFDPDADTITYGPLHGYTLFDETGKAVAFPFGFGLSYTHFTYRAFKAMRRGEALAIEVSVGNTGDRTGTEIVQLYVGFPGRAASRPRKVLRGFERVSLEPGQTRTLQFRVPLADLTWYDPATAEWSLEKGAHTVFVGGSSRQDDLLSATVMV